MCQICLFFCGAGNLSKAFLSGNKKCLGFDREHNPHHDLCMADGLRLAILCPLHAFVESLVWFGAPWGSWSVMCVAPSRRNESNVFLGDELRQFARTGNKLMDVT